MIEISAALNDFRLAGVVSFFAQGPGSATVDIYPLPRPSFGGDPTSTKLATVALKTPIGEIVAGALVVTDTDPFICTGSGEAAWARCKNGAGAIGWDCSVSDIDGTGEMKLDSTMLYAGGYTRIIGGTLV